MLTSAADKYAMVCGRDFLARIRLMGETAMAPEGQLTPAEWYEAAESWHTEHHQGCPCCRACHCVFRSEWGERVEYHCTACDFSASRDQRTGRCFTTSEVGREQPSTLLDDLQLCGRELADD
jgi:hypothetical protein